jgi:hypothetical protein
MTGGVMLEGWTLEQAREQLIAVLQPVSRTFGYHVCLGGGVLNNGFSSKDADIYFLPLEKEVPPNPAGVVKMLDAMWGEGGDINGMEYPLPPDSIYHAKRKYLNHPNYRVDVFIMKGGTSG